MDFKAGLYDASGSAVTGSTDLVIKIKRDADEYFYDFDDSTFKASGWISISSQLSEPDAVNMPGEYEAAVDVSAWNDGVYTAYIQYSGSPAWTDAVEFRIYDGKESLNAIGVDVTAILADTSELQAELADGGRIDALIDSIVEDTAELQGLISSSKIAAQVKGIDAGAVTASAVATGAIDADALATDAATEIATAVMAKIVDGSIDLTECLKVILAAVAGDMAKSDNTYTYDDQGGTVKLTEVVSIDTVERTIA